MAGELGRLEKGSKHPGFDEKVSDHLVRAVTVNHNTSDYLELMLRSLFHYHPSGLNLALTVYDNDSQDDSNLLHAYAASKDIPIFPSGFNTETLNNSHGEILSKFVLGNPGCSHYIFLDPDIVFLEDHSLNEMLAELENSPDAFGIGPRMSWDGVDEIPHTILEDNPDILHAGLHPCCALVKKHSPFPKCC